ncbi:type III secretion protein HrpN [Erwinia psidii]|uniref:type III secretion protein HrpN n=1 Tax=Erwinia psidii TaxID=69224 RepID=UPI00226B97EC|nr:type III secretion protein HrpN [Erwinia psidii]MCX8960673.1 type III secretion protein HrpN [Erwinia psidii]
MSLNTSPLGATTLQHHISSAGSSNGLLGTSLQNAGLISGSLYGSGSSQNDTINQLAGMLTGMMMMMSMMGGNGLSGLLGGSSGNGLGSGLGNSFGGSGLGSSLGGVGGGLGSAVGGGLGTVAGGAVGGPLGATVGGSLGSTLGGSTGSAVGSGLGSGLSSLDKALGLSPTTSTGSSYGNGSSLTSGSDSTSGSSPIEQLMKMFAEIMQSMFGDQDGSQGSSTGSQPTQDEQNAYNKGVTDALTALMGGGLSQSMGTSALGGGTGSGQGGGTGSGLGGGTGSGLGGGTGLGSSSLGAGNGLGGKSLQSLSGAADFEQLGNAVGTGVGMKAGVQALNNIGTHSDSSTRSFINKDDRAMAKEVGKFMDQYPETFGKPQYQKNEGSAAKTDTKSWAEALSKPDDDGMTPGSMDQFNKAKGIIKSAMEGDTGNSNLQARGAGGSSLGFDAVLTGDTINNMALGKLSAA